MMIFVTMGEKAQQHGAAQQNAVTPPNFRVCARQKIPKFAIFCIYENPKLLFPFFILRYFISFPNKCPGLYRQSTYSRVFIMEKIKLHGMKNGKGNFGFSNIQDMAEEF